MRGVVFGEEAEGTSKGSQVSSEIKYLCHDCRRRLGRPEMGWHAVNEVGRKSCDACGSNHDNLNVVAEDQFNEVMGINKKSPLDELRETISASKMPRIVIPKKRKKGSNEFPAWLLKKTFVVQYNPGCPKKFLVRLVSPGTGCLDMKHYHVMIATYDKTKDVLGFGRTLREAAEDARREYESRKKLSV